MTYTIDTEAARELELYAVNFSSAHYNSVGKTLSKFYQKGTFSLDRAIAYIERYLLVPAAKDYKLCCGSMATAWNVYFPKPERLVAAESIAHAFVSEFRLGNFWWVLCTQHNHNNIMAVTNYNAERDFMRRMIRAYEQDLLQLLNETPNHPGGDWAKNDLTTLEYLRTKTFSDTTQTITF